MFDVSKKSLDKWPKVGGSMPPELKQYGKFEDEALMEHTHDIPAGFTQNEVRKFFIPNTEQIYLGSL